MRLIDCQTLKLVDFENEDALPPYAILSHTWGQDDVRVHNDIFFGDDRLDSNRPLGHLNTSLIHDRSSLQASSGDFEASVAPDGPSPQVFPWRWRYQTLANKGTYKKLHSLCTRAAEKGLEYVWIDVCCIDRSNIPEISATINSMFRWYKRARICYAYLEDVDGDDLQRSRWFTRGWTLPELIAPPEVLFFNTKWIVIGSRKELAKHLSDVTLIDSTLLCRDPGEDVSLALERFDVKTRMSWAKSRKTTRIEDEAYCLMGIFNVYMSLVYGEGENARRRLWKEINQQHPEALLFDGDADKLSLQSGTTLNNDHLFQIYNTQKGRGPRNSKKMMISRSGGSKYLSGLEEQLFDAEVRTTSLQQFVPAGDLDRIIHKGNVLRCVQEVFPDLMLEDHISQARAICSLDRPFRRIFGVLILSDMVDEISTFLELDLHDGYLPMPENSHRERSRSLDIIEPPEGDSKWRTFFKRCSRRSRLSVFSSFQWRIIVPIFTNVDDVQHFKFSPEVVLPFIRSEEPEESPEQQIRYGAFSQVRKAWIHPQHDRFENAVAELSRSHRTYAIKSLHSHSIRAFEREVDILKRFRGQPNIVQLLCTFETQRTFVGEPSSTYHMIFPWAEGDLRTFWEKKDALHGDTAIWPWLVNQCHGLASGLAAIHGGIKRSSDTVEDEPTYGRHGDITAHNILWFPSDDRKGGDLGRLVIGDFGLSDFHTKRSRSDLTSQSIARSGTYRSPEFDTSGMISRKADIWMLGCVFLEMVTWYVEGNHAVQDEFPKARTCRDIYGMGSDNFFLIRKDAEAHRTAVIKPEVKQWIKRLKDSGRSAFVDELLDLIEIHMLSVDVTRRIGSAELSERLKKILGRVKDVELDRVMPQEVEESEVTVANSLGARSQSKRVADRRHWIMRLASFKSRSGHEDTT